jgi:murein DD-endopeptidase MepM/ murein hydrolase activator NlpD
VTSDTVIGTMGGTGKIPSFPTHLHYERIISETMQGNVKNGKAAEEFSIERTNAINPWILLPQQ